MAEGLKSAKRWLRRSRQEWQELCDRFAASGLGIEAFCDREGISKSSFGRWRNVLADGGMKAETASPGAAGGFVDAGLIGLGVGSGRLAVKLDLGGGVFLHLVRG